MKSEVKSITEKKCAPTFSARKGLYRRNTFGKFIF